MDNFIVIIGVIGSLASILGYLIQMSGIKSKVIHALYGFMLVGFTSYFVNEAAITKTQNENLRMELAKIQSIEYQARNLLDNVSRYSDGDKRGFMLASLSMLEKFKLEKPDTYQMAKEFTVASGVLKNEQENGMKRLYQTWALSDGSDAMEALLKGLAGAKG